MMIQTIGFQNFRGFSDLKLEGVQPITLISGRNNVGKSSVLDGLFLFFDHLAPESFVKINGFRGIPPMTEPKYLWEPVFYGLDITRPMEIALDLSDGRAVLHYERDTSYVVPEDADVPRNVLNQFISTTGSSYTLKFQYTHNDYWETGHFISSASGLLRHMETSLDGDRILPMPFTQFINSVIIQSNGDVAALLGEVEMNGKKDLLLEVLRTMEPSISDITTIMTPAGTAQIYLRFTGQLLPVKLAGDGLNKLMFLLLSIMAHPGSLLLIDEIETGVHYSAYADLWRSVAQMAEVCGCQIIATTHSYECIVGAIEGLQAIDAGNRFCYFRIDRQGGTAVARRYSDALLRTAIDTSLEVR